MSYEAWKECFNLTGIEDIAKAAWEYQNRKIDNLYKEIAELKKEIKEWECKEKIYEVILRQDPRLHKTPEQVFRKVTALSEQHAVFRVKSFYKCNFEYSQVFLLGDK